MRVLAKTPKIALPASFEGESRVRRGLFLRYEQELTNEYPVQTRKEKYGFSKNNFRNQRENGQKWPFLATLQRLRSTFDPRRLSDVILSAFLASISDGIYLFLGVLIPPNRNRGLRRLLSASASFFEPSEWIRKVGRGANKASFPGSALGSSNGTLAAMVCSLLSIPDTVCSFLPLFQMHDWPYVLGALWTYRALRYLHFESTRHFSVREIFE